MLFRSASEAPAPRQPAAEIAPSDCRPALDKVNAQLAAAARREEMLRKQLDALKAIERGILEREDRIQTQAR